MARSAVSLPHQKKGKTSGDPEGGWQPPAPDRDLESKFVEASSWCPGLVSSQYFTSMRCISLLLALNSLNHAGCVITTSRVFSFSFPFSFLFLSSVKLVSSAHLSMRSRMLHLLQVGEKVNPHKYKHGHGERTTCLHTTVLFRDNCNHFSCWTVIPWKALPVLVNEIHIHITIHK